MDFWLILMLAGGAVLLALRLWLGPAERQDSGFDADEGARTGSPPEPEPWEAEALARFGTETSIDQLVSEGRSRDLRDLGYQGDLPEE